MKLRLKFNLVLGLVTLVGIVGSGLLINDMLQKNAREEVLDTARVLMESAMAVRGYTVDEIRPLLALQQKRQFLPQTASRRIRPTATLPSCRNTTRSTATGKRPSIPPTPGTGPLIGRRMSSTGSGLTNRLRRMAMNSLEPGQPSKGHRFT